MRTGCNDAMTRRRFLNCVGQIIGALSLMSTGCGSGSTKSEEPTRQIKVQVPPELAGTDRTIYSAYAAPAALDAEGKGLTRSANFGAQLLMLADSSGSPRALSIALPGVEIQEMDAVTTAATLVFLTPGILTTLPDEAEIQLNRILSLPSFTALRQSVEIALSSRTLSDLQLDSEINRLHAACVEEWMQGRSVKTAASRSWQNDPARFSVEFSGGDAIELRSGAWRDEALLRERLDSRNQQVPDRSGPVLAPMEGAEPTTWGALFSSERFSLGRRNDRPEVDSDPPVGTIRYTVYGPGHQVAEPVLPDSLINQNPYGPTFFFIGALPIFDLVVGGNASLSRGWLHARNVWEGLSGKPDVSAAQQFIRQGETSRAAEQILPVVSGYLEEAEAIASGYGLFASNPLLVPEATDIIRMARFALSASSFLPAVEIWTSYPEVSVYELPVTSGEVVVK